MKQELVEVNLHGALGDFLKRKTWKLAVKSVGQAMNAIEVLSRRKLFKFLYENDARGLRYRVLINGRDFLYEADNKPNIDNIQSIKNSELCAKIYNLKTIDIVPVLSGAGKDFLNIFTIILGVILVVVGAYVGGPWGAALVMVGLGLLAAGVINLLSPPPKLDEFQERQKNSFLFSGPTNTNNEGGCVPVGYGNVLIGSSVISASYDVGYFDANDNLRIVENDN